jgi:hypothetical protein
VFLGLENNNIGTVCKDGMILLLLKSSTANYIVIRDQHLQQGQVNREKRNKESKACQIQYDGYHAQLIYPPNADVRDNLGTPKGST